MWRCAVVLALVTATLLGIAPSAHGGATTVPSYRIGTCEDGAACSWDCSVSDNQNPFCGDGSFCAADVTETFTAHVVVRADDAPCGSAGGSVIEIGLRGRKADGSKFTVPSRTINLCGVNNVCDGCDASVCACGGAPCTCVPADCPDGAPETCCAGVLRESCPLASIFNCEKAQVNSGQFEECDVAPDGYRFCEEDLMADGGTRFGGWLVAGRQPLPPFVFGDLAPHFPSAVDVPFVSGTVNPEVLQVDDHVADGQPSTTHLCVTFDFLRTVKPKPIPAAVIGAPFAAGSLVVKGDCKCPLSPRPSCTAFDGGLLLVSEETPGREKLVAKWLEGPALSGAAFGDPLASGGTEYDVCLYDANGALAGQYTIARAGSTCGGGPCWKSVGGAPGSPEHKGYRYRDKDVTADGMLRLLLKGGDAGMSKTIAKGKNNVGKGQLALPLGTAAALAGSSSVTMQLFPSDAPTCLSATLSTVIQDTGSRFKAK